MFRNYRPCYPKHWLVAWIIIVHLCEHFDIFAVKQSVSYACLPWLTDFMELRNIYIFTLLITCFECRAQVSAVVFDMETKRPVSKVKVYVNPKGSVLTDSHGRFNFAGKCNSMTFSHVSYESRSLRRSELRDTVWIMPKMNTLEEVVIMGVRPKFGFDINRMSREVSSYGKTSSGLSFDFFSAFDKSQKRKSGKERERYRKMLERY